MEMRCEYNGCNSNDGSDYKRLPYEKEMGWEDEPIFLCDEHAQDRNISNIFIDSCEKCGQELDNENDVYCNKCKHYEDNVDTRSYSN